MSEQVGNQALAIEIDDDSAIAHEERQPAPAARKRAGKPGTIQPREVKISKVVQDRNRDENLTDFGKKTLVDRYLLPEESYQDMFARVAEAYCDDSAHAQRLYNYMSNLWFMPATRGLTVCRRREAVPQPAVDTRMKSKFFHCLSVPYPASNSHDAPVSYCS